MTNIGDQVFQKAITLLTEGTDPAHAVTKAYVDAGGDPPLVTQEAFTITVDSGGTDPAAAFRVTSQAEADAHGDFLTVGGAIGALYGLLLSHLVTIQLPAGNWNLVAGELDQMWRVLPTGVDAYGSIRISGDPGWTQVAATTEELASSDGAGNVTFASDPAPVPDAKAYYLYVVSGTGAGQFKPIRTQAGVNGTVAGRFSPALDGTSLIRIAEPATTLIFNKLFPIFRGFVEGNFSNLAEFWHLNLETNPVNGWFSVKSISLKFDGGTRFNNMGLAGTLCQFSFGDVSFDHRIYSWTSVHIRSGLLRGITGSRTALFLGGGVAFPAIDIQSGGSSYASFGIGNDCLLFGHFAFDGWTGPYIKAEGGSSTVTLGPWTPRSDQGGSVAVALVNGADCRIVDMTEVTGSTFKGATVDVDLDGNTMTWATIDADAEKTARSSRGSIVMEE
jgi:hypothetical protein